MTITEFLIARLAEEEGERQRDFAQDAATVEERQAMESAWGRTLEAAALRANIAARSAGWSMVAAVRPQTVRARVQRYADHPDFDPAWSLS